MELKQQNQVRIIFLKKFTREILLHFYEKERVNQKIEIEKLRQKFPVPSKAEEISPQETFKKIITRPKTISSEYQPSMIHINNNQPIKNLPSSKKFPIKLKPRVQPIRPIQKPIFKSQQPQLIKKPIDQIVEEKKHLLAEIKPEFQPQPMGFDLGKIESLIQDNSIQLIECPGPGKNILVKRYNQQQLTKISLNQAEISNVIDAFSKEARIPATGGILKTAVGNLVISAVISDFVGSRFIINKMTPFSMMNRQ